MTAYVKVHTSHEVYCAIWQRHGNDLHVFSSFTELDGGRFGDPNRCEIFTEWGFKGASAPVMGHRRVWDKDETYESNRKNESVSYWLCSAIEEG